MERSGGWWQAPHCPIENEEYTGKEGHLITKGILAKNGYNTGSS
jgi:hypothetical protein